MEEVAEAFNTNPLTGGLPLNWGKLEPWKVVEQGSDKLRTAYQDF